MAREPIMAKPPRKLGFRRKAVEFRRGCCGKKGIPAKDHK